MKKKKSKKTKFDPTKIFSKMKSMATAESYKHDSGAGIDIHFSMKNFGFGHVNFWYDKKTDTLRADTECMSKESVEKIIVLAAPSLAELFVKLDNL